MESPRRYAVYYVPAAEDPLWAAGCAWLGRNPETGRVPRPAPGIAAHTTAPARYGFHATLRPPFALAPGQNFTQFRAACAAILAAHRPFSLPPLTVGQLDGFLALLPTRPCPQLNALADALVLGLDGFRPPLSAQARARRRPEALPSAEVENLDRFGYPAVLAAWRFHLTLSNRMPPATLRRLAEAHFAASLAPPRQLGAIALFTEPAPDAEFQLMERLSLAG